jgi:hypothetical protein
VVVYVCVKLSCLVGYLLVFVRVGSFIFVVVFFSLLGAYFRFTVPDDAVDFSCLL